MKSAYLFVQSKHSKINSNYIPVKTQTIFKIFTYQNIIHVRQQLMSLVGKSVRRRHCDGVLCRDQAASGSRPDPLTIQLAEIPRLDFSLRIRERTWQFLEITNVLIHRENQLTHNYINRHYQKDIITLYTARVTL